MGDAPATETARAGLFASLKGLLGTSVGLFQNRLQLLGVELAEERLRLLSLLTYGAIAFVCLSAGIVFLAMFFTVLLWESHRLLVLGICTFLFLAAGGVALVLAMGRARAGGTLFSASLAELRRDGEHLTGDRKTEP
jgi:uncharacterized membrane protein YqjE